MSEAWYRHPNWSPEIEAEFEKRIARSRGQKAQYLMLQGQALIERHPVVAAGLLKRSIELDEEFHLCQANCYLALAELAQGNVDATLEAYEAAMEAQLRFRYVQSSAPLDYAFAVAWFGRQERYALALQILEAVQPSVFEGADFQAHAAHALILGAQGREDASAKARSAINGIPDDVDGVMWAGISFGKLRQRLTAIA